MRLKNYKKLKNSTFVFLLIALSSSISYEVFAQQDIYKWRFGLGLGNEYSQGNLVGESGMSGNEYASVKSDFLTYSIGLERLFSESWGGKLFLSSSPGTYDVQDAALIFSFYSDNRNLLGRRKFIAPYLSLGIGNDRLRDDFNIPFGAGLKFRVSQKFNLNFSYMAKTYVSDWNESGFQFGEKLIGMTSVSLHFNLKKRPNHFKAPRIYASNSYEYLEEIVIPVVSDTLVVLNIENDKIKIQSISNELNKVTAKFDTASVVKLDTVLTVLVTQTPSEIKKNKSQIKAVKHVMDTIARVDIDSISLLMKELDLSMAELDSLIFNDQSISLDTLIVVSDSVSIDISAEESVELDTVMSLILTTIGDTESDVISRDSLILDFSYDELLMEEPERVSDSIVTSIILVGSDTLFNVMEYRMDTITLPLSISEKIEAEKESSTKYYTEEEVRALLLKKPSVVESKNAPMQAFDPLNDLPVKSIQTELFSSTQFQAIPVSDFEVLSPRQSETKSSKAIVNTINIRQDSIARYLEKEIKNQQLENQLTQLRSISTEPQSQVLLTENNLNKEKEAIAQERNKFYLEKIAYLEQRLSISDAQSIPPVNQFTNVVTIESDSLNATTSEVAVEKPVAANSEENKELIELQSQIEALKIQINSLKEAMMINKLTIPTPTTNTVTMNEMEKLKSEIELLKSPQPETAPVEIIKTDDAKVIPSQKSIVFFAINSDQISAIGHSTLEKVVSLVTEYSDADVLIKGFTDMTGSPEYNVLLSKRRADNVAAYLIGRGIAKRLINISFEGADLTLSGKGQAYGRRVEIILE